MSDYLHWTMPGNALISTIDTVESLLREDIPVALLSGGFDPIHPGHISYIQESAIKVLTFYHNAHGQLPSTLTFIVAVNSDRFLELKKGHAFMPLKARCQVVSAILSESIPRIMPIVMPFVPTDIEDMSMNEAIERLKPNYFCKGGDRNVNNIPETPVCRSVGTQIISGCGDDKFWSSSNFLKDYEDYIINNRV